MSVFPVVEWLWKCFVLGNVVDFDWIGIALESLRLFDERDWQQILRYQERFDVRLFGVVVQFGADYASLHWLASLSTLSSIVRAVRDTVPVAVPALPGDRVAVSRRVRRRRHAAAPGDRTRRAIDRTPGRALHGGAHSSEHAADRRGTGDGVVPRRRADAWNRADGAEPGVLIQAHDRHGSTPVLRIDSLPADPVGAARPGSPRPLT